MTRDEADTSGEQRESRDDDDRIVVVKRSGGTMMPFLIGLAVGAGLALLFAPASGAETRRRIARGARRVKDAAAGAAGEMTGKVSDTIAAARERVEAGVEAVRDTVAAKRGSVDRAMKEGKAAARQARQDIEKRLAETKAAYQAGARVARESRSRDD